MFPIFLQNIEGYDRILDNIRRGIPCYFENRKAGIVIKYVPPDDDEFYARPKVGAEYRINRKSNVVMEAFLEGHEITAEEYDSYNLPASEPV
jgi:hypothetical protein